MSRNYKKRGISVEDSSISIGMDQDLGRLFDRNMKNLNLKQREDSFDG